MSRVTDDETSHYSYVITTVTKANIESPPINISDIMRDHDSPRYALCCLCTKTTTHLPSGRQTTSLGVAYYVPSKGTVIADLHDNTSTKALTQLAMACIQGDDDWQKMFYLGKLIEDHALTPPPPDQMEKVFLDGFTTLNAIKHDAETAIKADLANATRLIEIALEQLPPEYLHQFPLLVCKTVEPLTSNFSILISTHTTPREKANAKVHITAALKSIPDILTESTIAKAIAQKVIDEICKHIFDLHSKQQLVQFIDQKLNMLIPFVSRAVLDIISDKKTKEDVITDFFSGQLETSSLSIKRMAVETVVRAAMQPSASESIEVLAKRICASDLAGKTEEQQLHLLILKQSEIIAGRAVASATPENRIEAELKSIGTQLQYRQLVLKQKTEKKCILPSVFAGSASVSDKSELHETKKLKTLIDSLLREAKSGNNIAVYGPTQTDHPKLADITLQINSTLKRAAELPSRPTIPIGNGNAR